MRSPGTGFLSFGGTGWEPGPVIGLLLAVLVTPFMPIIIALRLARITKWTLEASARPWGRRGPRQVMRWEVKGWAESDMALQLLVDGFKKGDGAPDVPFGERVA
jgi:hypothetical protein